MLTSGFRISWMSPDVIASIDARRSARRFSCSSSLSREMSLRTATAPRTGPSGPRSGRGGLGRCRREPWGQLPGSQTRRGPGQSLGGTIEQGDPATWPERHHAALDRLEHLVQLLVHVDYAPAGFGVAD